MQESNIHKKTNEQEKDYFYMKSQQTDFNKYEKNIIEKLKTMEQSIDEAYKNNNENSLLLKLKNK